MTDRWDDAGDRLLARSIFGTEDPDSVDRMIGDWLAARGFAGASIRAIELSVGAAVTVEVDRRFLLVVKVWPGTIPAEDLNAQIAVQSGLAARGFPAPAILADLSPLGPGRAVAMACRRDGMPTDARIPGVRRHMARGLARLVIEADDFLDIVGLPRRALPPAPSIWPPPHNALFDFEVTRRGAAWIDEIAEVALATMRDGQSRIVVGHQDWSAKNMRMGRDGIAMVYDWDSLFSDRETFVVGAAAAHFPMTWALPVPATPRPEDVASFVHDYEEARGRPFSAAERAEVAAGATYARAYKARCEHALDAEGADWHGSSRESLKINGAFRFDGSSWPVESPGSPSA